MNGYRFVIADTDEAFALKIQEQLEKKVSEDAEIVIVTDNIFLNELFSAPQKMDALLIRKELYSKEFEKHNIDSICIITDSLEECRLHSEGYIKLIYRYSPVSEIASKLTKELVFSENNISDTNACSIISVISPCGGSGKTVFSLALCYALQSINKKVVYIDTSNVQSSSYWLNCIQKNFDDFQQLDDLMDCITDNIIYSDSFDYILPFDNLLTSLGINASIYLPIIKKLKSENKYDCIVIDTDSNFSCETLPFLANSESVFVLAIQDAFSIEKLKKFKKSIECANIDKYKFVCNQFKDDKKDYFKELMSDVETRYIIPFINVSDATDLKAVSELSCFQKIVTMFS